MSSERLYYTDAYLVEFDAVVRDVAKHEDRWKVTLDRTAFYPTSGGQPFDVGTLDDARVLDVFDQEDGTVAHIVDRELEINCRVRGQIDWDRRFDHMQQHTGQHLLSAAFEREAGAKTISFHLGTGISTIDLDKEVAPDLLRKVESAANKIVWEDREVCVKFVSASEAAKLPLRKDPARGGELRIVDIHDYDLSACGGTHVCRTGGIGVICLASAERFKGGQRVGFACGYRALSAYRELKDAVSGSVRLLSVLPAELPAAIEKLQASSRAQSKEHEALQDRLIIHEAEDLASKAQPAAGINVVAQAMVGWDANGLKKLASAVAAKPGMAAVLLKPDEPSLIVVSRASDVNFDAGDVLRKLVEQFGGKGGGRGAMAQGGGLSGSPEEVLSAARRLIGGA